MNVKRKSLVDVFTEVAMSSSKEEIVNVLRSNESWELKNVLKGAFDPNVQFVFKQPLNYRKTINPAGFAYSRLVQEIDRAYLFQVNHPKVSPNLTQERKEQLAIQILEGLEETESKIFMNMMLKDLKVPGLTYDIVKEAFPNL